MRFPIRELAALLPLAVVPGSATELLTPAPRVDGYAITMEMTSSDQREKMAFTLKLAGDKMRLEMDFASMGGGGNAQAAQMMGGAFMLAQGAGKIAMVLPSMNMGFNMDVGAMAAQMGASGTAAQCDAVANLEDLGAGETMLGYATRKYRSRSAVPATRDRPAGDEVVEMWLATNLAGAEDAFRKFTESFGRQFAGGTACPGAVMEKMPKGFPMRFITTPPGGNAAEVSRMDVTKVEKMSFAPSDFELPAGIRLIDGGGMGMMGGRGRGGM